MYLIHTLWNQMTIMVKCMINYDREMTPHYVMSSNVQNFTITRKRSWCSRFKKYILLWRIMITNGEMFEIVGGVLVNSILSKKCKCTNKTEKKVSWKTFLYLNIQGVQDQILLIQLPLSWIQSKQDPRLVKSKCVWEIYNFFYTFSCLFTANIKSS